MPQPSPTLSLIALTSENGVLAGPVHSPVWRAPWLANRSVQMTRHRPVILGRKAFHYMNMLAADRWLFVLTRDDELLEAGGNHHLSGYGFWYMREFTAALDAARSLARTKGVPEVFVAGGVSVLASALPHAGRIYRTQMHETIDGAGPLDRAALAGWRTAHSERRVQGGGGVADQTYAVLERPQAAG